MKAVEAINKNQVVLLVFKSNTSETLLDLCKNFSKNNHLGIILSANPARFMLQKLKNAHIDSSKIFFIDCISKERPKSENIIYISSPAALTELSLAISSLLKSGGIDIIILDNLSTLLIYNRDIVLVRFLHDLVGKVRNSGKKLVINTLAKDNQGSLASLPLFCDVVIEVP